MKNIISKVKNFLLETYPVSHSVIIIVGVLFVLALIA